MREWRTTAPSTCEAFSSGNSRSATATALTTRSFSDGASSGRRAFRSLRRAAAATMSISAESTKCGIVAFDSTIRRAIVCCLAVSATVSETPLSNPVGLAAGGAAGAWAAARRTSARMIRPPGPVPRRSSRATSSSAAVRRATGVARCLPGFSATAGGTAAADAAAPALSPGNRRRAITAPSAAAPPFSTSLPSVSAS